MNKLPIAVLALMVNPKGEVLAVSRKTNHEDLGFPGGKPEPGETYEKALAREIFEETGCQIFPPFETVFATVDNAGYLAIAYLVRDWFGEPVAREAGKVLWVPPERLIERSCTWWDYNEALFETLKSTGLWPP